jgi:glucosamine--fructose-6-phosphate aminotransferase (isomerizing)
MTVRVKGFKTKGKVVDLEKASKRSQRRYYWSYTLGNMVCQTYEILIHIFHSGDLAIVHNGIIENYAPLKAELTKEAMFSLRHRY